RVLLSDVGAAAATAAHRHALPRDVTKSPSFALGNRHHAGRRAADRAGSLAQGRRVRSVQAATRVITGRVLDVLNSSFSASWVFTKDTLETSPSERQHVRRRGKFLGYSCNAATLCVLRHVPAHMRRPPTPPVLECNPIPTLFAQGPVLDASDVQGRATGSAKRCPSFDSPSDFSCCFRASTRRRDSPTSPRVFLKRGGSVDSPFQGEILFL
ncbi:hypothetical protein GGF50DRAFT_93272, partial [Schizophyllum commune]